MITINFYWAISLYIFLFLGALVGFWLLERRQKDKDLSLDAKFIWFCSVCTYTYINTQEESISLCPRCNSYNKKNI